MLHQIMIRDHPTKKHRLKKWMEMRHRTERSDVPACNHNRFHPIKRVSWSGNYRRRQKNTQRQINSYLIYNIRNTNISNVWVGTGQHIPLRLICGPTMHLRPFIKRQKLVLTAPGPMGGNEIHKTTACSCPLAHLHPEAKKKALNVKWGHFILVS